MKLLKIKISRRPELVTGIHVKEGSNWIIIQENPVDYILDGYTIINKVFIKSIIEPFEKDSFEYKIFDLKYRAMSVDLIFDLDTDKALISFFERTDKLIGLELESDDYTLVGKVSKVNDKSFLFKMIGTKGQFLREENLKFSSIRKVDIDTDYLQSLENYLKEYPDVLV